MVGSLVEMFVFSEEIVEDSECGLEVQVYNVLWSRLGLRKSSIHHQLECQTHVSNSLVKRLK